jgi:outer membrane biosynthesis protein TonB
MVFPDATVGEGPLDVAVGPVGVPVDGGLTGVTALINPPAPPQAPTVATAGVEPPAKPVNISGAVLASKLITKVVPAYPVGAKAVRVQGQVRLIGIIGIDGRVKSLRVIDGHPLLRKAAEEAVWQWIYSPTYLTGKPVEVEAAIEVNFALK